MRTQKREKFLSALSDCGNVSSACLATALARRTAYNWRHSDKAFSAVWDAAQELGTDALEDEAARRAAEGTLKPVFYQGNECGRIREYSDTLLIFLLKARRPERFKERVSKGHLVDDLRNRTANELRAELEALC